MSAYENRIGGLDGMLASSAEFEADHYVRDKPQINRIYGFQIERMELREHRWGNKSRPVVSLAL